MRSVALTVFLSLAAGSHVLADSHPRALAPWRSPHHADPLHARELSSARRSLHRASHSHKKARAPLGQWTLQQKGNTGVAAMQIAVVGDHHVIIIDKAEQNPLQVNGHPAWGALYDLNTDQVMPLDMITNSFCAGGTFLSNGTLINLGGTAVEPQNHVSTRVGLQAVRFFEPSCLSNPSSCRIAEYPGIVRMAKARWYPSTVRLHDGSALIVGGSTQASFINSAKINVPSLEYYPPKTFSFSASPGAPIPMPFLSQTLNANLFPFLITLPTPGKVLLIANTQAIIYSWKTNKIKRLPSIPNGVRVTYPMTASGTLLPLSPSNGFQPEVLICGGTTVNDKLNSHQMNSQSPASNQCARLVLTSAGIANGWQIETMPFTRVMPDMILMPNGKILIVNGAQTGVAGYGNAKNQIGASNADNPAFQPVLYDPNASIGSRFSTSGLPATTIARLYHSVASLTPQGKIMIAGSNPNGDVSTTKYATEYRVEYYSPPWIGGGRPIINSVPAQLQFGQVAVLRVSGVDTSKTISANVMDYGFITHSVHMNSRLVELDIEVLSPSRIQITAPPNGAVYPPGVGWIHVVVDGIPSIGHKVLIGSGDSPPVDEAAIRGVQAMPGP